MPRLHTSLLVIVAAMVPGALRATTTLTTSLGQLQDCLNTAGSGDVCQLQARAQPYTIPYAATNASTCNQAAWCYVLIIPASASGVTLQGTGFASETVIQRGDASVVYLVFANSGVSGVKINNIRFDGNRSVVPGRYIPWTQQWDPYGCPEANASYWDVDFSMAGGNPNIPSTLNEISSTDFWNAPSTALLTGGYTAVSYSYFFNARSTGAYIADTGNYGGVWYTYFVRSGTAGVTVNGPNMIIYGNSLYLNRYEQPDDNMGGQLVVERDGDCASVAANTVDGGNHWMTPATVSETGCTAVAGLRVVGMEPYGTGIRLFNNGVFDNSAGGVTFTNANPTSDVTISGSNPWDASDSPRYVEGNWQGGIAFLPYNGGGTQGITLDHVRVRNNIGTGVHIENATGTGFINNACMYGNTTNVVVVNSTLTYPQPQSYSVCP